MKIIFAKNRNELISVLLLGLSAVFGLIILFKAGGLLVTSVRDGVLVKKAIARSVLDPNEAEVYFAKSKAVAEELKKKNLFMLPKSHPAQNVSGILGNEVLINGRWYKAGDKVGDAEILEIEPTRVKIRWNGNEQYFSPIVAAASVDGPKKKKAKAVVKKKKEKETKIEKPAEVKKVEAPVAEEDPLAWIGVELSASLRAKFLEKWDELTDEQKEKAKEDWNNLSDDQKQQAIDAWEQHL